MSITLEKIKEMNLKIGEAIEVLRIFPSKECGCPLSDTNIGYYLGLHKKSDKYLGNHKKSDKIVDDYLYITNSKFMSEYALKNPSIINHSSIISHLTSFPINEIEEITRK